MQASDAVVTEREQDGVWNAGSRHRCGLNEQTRSFISIWSEGIHFRLHNDECRASWVRHQPETLMTSVSVFQ